ncbi:MAG: DNA-protecting protein DprA [Burkholderiales bacterium]|nr:MAG: DNA-protecting protein DprA [Burkholderiales bacterium]
MSLAPDDAEDLAHWLRLALTPGVGPVGARALLEQFGLPHAIFESGGGLLDDVAGGRLASALRERDAVRERRIEHALEWAQAAHHHLVTLADADYPPMLLRIADAPPLLYVVGRREALSRSALAIVGSRNPTAAGVANARAFGFALSRAGWTIASGMALGVDGAAHDGALEGGAGTVAVVGTGVDVIYPSRHRRLAERIAADGAIVSELPLGTEPSPGQFPRRNRLIAGMSHGVLVVEAALHSGSLITARQAGEFGRDVFAIPGSIHSPLSRGCHALIRQGAVLVGSAEDVLDELPHRNDATDPPTRPMSASTYNEPELLTERLDVPDYDPILAAIGQEPVLPDTLAAHLGMAAGDLGARLVVLELSGRLERLPDGRVVRPPPVG